MGPHHRRCTALLVRGAPRGDLRACQARSHPGGGCLSRHLALVGCTASGKSTLALELADRLQDVEIVVADSMQVYKGMDIGTAKPTPDDQARVVHHLLDLADPGDDFSVARWVGAARQAIAAIERRHHRALLVAGTGLYFQSLVDRLEPPGRWPEVRARLEHEDDTAALHHQLVEVDPVAASRMLPTNRRRVIRALEVALGSGRPFSSYGPGMNAFPETSWRIAGVWLPRRVIARRIDLRLEMMLASGLIDETERLRDAGLSRTAGQALGYKEILAHIERGVPLHESLQQARRRTRAFARRQRVWWRRDPRVRWFGSAENPLAVLPLVLGDWRTP